jgi:hypothetical protein
MPKPAPLRHYLARKRTAGEEPSEGSTGQLAEDEELKISEEHQVTDPLLVRAPAAGGVAIGGVTGGQAAEAPAELPPQVTIRPGKKAVIEGPFLESDGSVDFCDEEEPEVATSKLMEEPSLFELYRERLVHKYNFAEDDPVFALAEIYSEAERRALARNTATENSCARMVAEMEKILHLVCENVEKLERGFREIELLEELAQGLREAAETIEALLIEQQEDTQTRLKALDLLQKDLTRDVNNALQRRITDYLVVVLTVLFGIVIGSNLHWFFGR